MKVVGITGSIGTGKSTVARLFRRMGYDVIDLDECAKALLGDADVRREIMNSLGVSLDGPCGTKRLAQVVFSDKEKLAMLEGILHPRVIALLDRKIEELRERGKELLFVDGPLIFEKGLNKRLDFVIVVSAEEGLVEDRLRRRGMDEEDVRRRRSLQIALREKEEMADFVIYNNGTISELEGEAMKCLEEIRRNLHGTPE